MPAPSFTLAQIIDQLQTQWGGADEGTYRSWAGATVNYSIPNMSPNDEGNGEAAGFNAAMMTSYKRDMAREAFELWDDLIAINLTENSATSGAVITMAYSSATNDDGTYASTWTSGASPNYDISKTRIWLADSWASLNNDSDIEYSKYGFNIYLHEIGHALGLSHPGTYDASDDDPITYAANAEYAQDTRQNTIMSYFGGWENHGGTWEFVNDGESGAKYSATPMIHDIAAIQAIYGADMTTRSGNTTYGFNSNANRDVFDFTINTTPIFAIWDAGGTDTIDASGFSQDQTINLNDGMLSSIGALESNIGIAYNAIIENAIGGSGEDTLIGNEFANELTGNGDRDLIKGGGGADTLSGGEGDDYLAGEAQNDTLKGGGGSDDLYGGSGGDTVKGGGGADHFVMNAPNDGVDTILDFNLDEGDQLWLDNTALGIGGTGSLAAAGISFVLGPSSLSATPTLRYYQGDLYWNPDGTGPQPAVLLAHVGGISTEVVGVSAGSGAGWSVIATGDFNNSGSTDIMWKNNADGSTAGWLMSNGTASSTPMYLSAAGWSVIATGDFNNNGTTDVLWKSDADGSTAAWYMSGAGVGSHPALSSAAGWSVVASGDFNSNGTDDILFKNDADGSTAVWLMSGAGIASSGFLWSAAGWDAVADGDFNGDGNTDVLWKNAADGSTAAWMMAGGTVGSGVATLSGAGWSVLTTGDFNDNGTDDILWKNDVTGATAVWLMSASGVESSEILLGAGGWDLAATGDFNYDGTDDLLWKNVADGSTAAWLMSGGDIGATELFASASGYNAIADGDFNRDGTTDVLWQAADGSIIDWQFTHVTASSFLVV